MLGDRAGQLHDHSRPRYLQSVSGRMAQIFELDRTRRTPWPRASGPSSRITGAEPACTVSVFGCARALGVRSCPAGVARAAARYLPDRNVGFFAVLSARNRMRRSNEFDATVKYGMRTVQPDIVVHVRRGSSREATSGPRVGLIIAKPVGSAVERHRVARRLRHVARTMLGDLRGSDQVVIRALPSSRHVSSAWLEQQLRTGLRRAFDLSGAQR